MKARRVFSLKFVAFALTPVVTLLVAAEATLRLKYFLAPTGHDWRYLTTPIGRGSVVPPDPPSAASQDRAAVEDQMVVHWKEPCVNQTVYSADLRKEMPRTFDEHCLRGDRVAPGKAPGEYRIVFLGGSTVEDAQSDDEMMTARFKRLLPATHHGKRTTVVNAGKANFDSRTIHAYWRSVIRDLAPDLVLYYEAWNEQQGDVKFTGMSVDERMAAFRRRSIHKALYYRSMLYTYLVERFGFRMVAGTRFWKIDTKQLRHVVELAQDVRDAGAHFVFVTQAVRFPRRWKNVDTFNADQDDALLERLRGDPHYSYDVTEISALNQRLAVSSTLDLCRRYQIPAIDILDNVEALGDAGRAGLFSDLGHLTVKGDRFVGELIAARLTAMSDFENW